MKNKIVSATIVSMMALLFLIFVSQVAITNASPLILPDSPVTIEVKDGTTSYFETKLTDVLPGYSVINAQTYPGWCIDRTADMLRSPATHSVQLYSSLNPPSSMAGEKWDIVNYLINHKSGTAVDMQEAIWHFVNMSDGFDPPSSHSGAWAIINDAAANGTGYVPTSTDRIAVICYPLMLFPTQEYVQITIIEVPQQSTPEETPGVSVSPSPSVSPTVPGVSVSPSPSVSPTESVNPSSDNESTPSIAGLVAVIIAALVVISLLILVFLKRKKQQ